MRTRHGTHRGIHRRAGAAFLLLGLLLAGFLPAGLPAFAADGSADVLPLDGPLRLTSSFGEYRAGHYHGGVDFSTGGRGGLPVRAPASGWVWRVRASGVGYGKALYLRLDDGRTAVFAHLSRFRPDVERRLEDEQDRLGIYEVDFRPEAGRFRFAKGDTVAWSGATGAGPPHLHAELRTGEEADEGINPLHAGWSVPDSVPPTLGRIRLAPAAPGARVDGVHAPRILAPEDTGPVRIAGPVRLWLEAEDRADPDGSRLAPWEVRLLVDGFPVARTRLDRISWHAPEEVEWTFDEAAARRKERWMTVDRPPGGRQPVHQGPGGPALGDLPPGTHRVLLEVEDVVGQVVDRAFTVVVEPGAKETAVYGLESPPPIGTGVSIQVAGPGDPVRVSHEGFSVTTTGEAFYTPFAWHVSRGQRPTGRQAELTPVGTTVELVPHAYPLRDRIEITLALPEGTRPTGVGIYSWQGEEDGWVFEGADPVPGGLRTGIRNLERLALFRDEVAPRVTLLHPAGPVGKGERPRLEARVEDEGAGVSWRTLTLLVDGEAVIAEWDPDAGILRGHPRGPLPAGRHRLAVHAEDHAGNEAEASITFTVR